MSNQWAVELERNGAFKEFIRLLEEMHGKKVTELVNARSGGKPLTNDLYHGLAGEARALKTAINLVARAAKSKEPAGE